MQQDKETDKSATDARSREGTRSDPSLQSAVVDKDLRPLLDTDEPPIIIGGGSLFLELPVNPASGRVKQLIQVSTGSHPITHEITEERNRALERVFVVIQPGAPGPVTTFDTGVLLENKNCILKIWLQLLSAAGDEFVFDPLDNDPDITIKGGNAQTGERTGLDLNRRGFFSTRSQTHKNVWPGRHELQGIPRHFRIGRVQILEGNNTTVIKNLSGGNGYQVYFTFHHH
jgi:hypothetical protein